LPQPSSATKADAHTGAALEAPVPHSQQALARCMETDTAIFRRHAVEALREIRDNRDFLPRCVGIGQANVSSLSGAA
jgi:hypothetical protein